MENALVSKEESRLIRLESDIRAIAHWQVALIIVMTVGVVFAATLIFVSWMETQTVVSEVRANRAIKQEILDRFNEFHIDRCK